MRFLQIISGFVAWPRALAILLLSLFSSSLLATDYVFTGNGHWHDPANWKDGLMPTSGLFAGSTVTITGTAINGMPWSECQAICQTMACSPSGCPPYLGGNKGTIIIAPGGTLTLRNYTQFSQEGVIDVQGTLINQTVLEGYNTGTITVSGTFINQIWYGNQGQLIINSGGVVRNEVSTATHPGGYKGYFDNNYVNPGSITINPGGSLFNLAPAVMKLGGTIINNGGVIQNSARMTGNPTIEGNLTNAGTLAPGASPGTYTINGNYTATASAVHEFEVGGTATGAYDALNASGQVNLAGSLSVSLIGGFSPTTDHDLPLFTGTINGTFATVNIPSQYVLVYNSNSVVLRKLTVVPVRFVSLVAKKEARGTKLVWKIEEEQDVVRYEVERSKDGRQFSTVGSVPARGLKEYAFADEAPDDKCFYRVKSRDVDGSYGYSSVVLVTRENATVILRAFPLPARKEVTLQHGTATTHSRITLSSIDGRVLRFLAPRPEIQQSTIDLSTLQPGTYILSYTDGSGTVENTKIVKQ